MLATIIEVKEVKKIKENYIELIKQGKFYIAHQESAVLIHYFFGYKILTNKKHKVGFPESCLEKIINTLEDYKINYVIKEKNEIIKSNDFKKMNKYENYIDKANEKLEIETRMSLMEYKIKKLWF